MAQSRKRRKKRKSSVLQETNHHTYGPRKTKGARLEQKTILREKKSRQNSSVYDLIFEELLNKILTQLIPTIFYLFRSISWELMFAHHSKEQSRELIDGSKVTKHKISNFVLTSKIHNMPCETLFSLFDCFFVVA